MWGRFFYGRALALQGRADDAVQHHLREGVAELAATGANIELPRCLAIPTEVAVGALTPRQGAQTILSSLATMGRGKHLTDVGEMYRIAGRLEYEAVGGEPDSGPTRAEQLLCQALRQARRHKAKSFELRAAIDLAGIWIDEGKTKAARRLIQPLYGWFKEGFGTRDLKAAKTLADALADGSSRETEFAGSSGG